MTRRECDFIRPKTHEFCMRETDGAWSKTWWQCSTIMAKALRAGDPGVRKFQIREIPPTSEENPT
jgi:hypothetical protein